MIVRLQFIAATEAQQINRAAGLRADDIMALRNPSDPFADRPDIGAGLRQALRAGG